MLNRRIMYKMHTAYIFDFDGTLVDSMPSWSGKVLNVLHQTQVSYPVDIIRRITPLGDLGTARYFQEELGVPLSIQQMMDMMDEYALPKYRDEIILKEGVAEYLHFLKGQGCSLNVLTASPHKMVDVCLKRNGIYDLFDNVWSCDDFGTTKSDPGIYTEAVKRIGVELGDAVFFDDNIGAVKTAVEAGLYTVAVYDPSGSDFADQLKGIADVYVESFTNLKRL